MTNKSCILHCEASCPILTPEGHGPIGILNMLVLWGFLLYSLSVVYCVM